MTDQPQDPRPPAEPAQPTGQPGHPPQQQNPYGYGPAPAYAGGRPMHPGSVGYVEQYFGPVADFGQRVLALFIDTLISIAAFIPMLVAIPVLIAGAPSRTGVYDDSGYPVMGEADSGLLTIGFLLLGLGIIIGIAISLWNRVFRMGRTGQSVGKSVIGLRLVHAHTGQPIGAGMCFVRELMSALINQLFYLSYLWMLWDDNKQTLADKVATSTVIVVPKS